MKCDRCNTVVFSAPIIDALNVEAAIDSTPHPSNWDNVISLVFETLGTDRLTVQWKLPVNATDLCAFRVHFYRSTMAGFELVNL